MITPYTSNEVMAQRLSFRNSLNMSFPASEIAQFETLWRDQPDLPDRQRATLEDIAVATAQAPRRLVPGQVNRLEITPAFMSLLGAGGMMTMHLGSPVYDQFTVVIILNLRNRVVGIVVDSVSDVMELTPESIRSAPDIESAIDNSCILGLGSVGERMLILLDIEKLMSSVDMGLVTANE